MVMEGTGQHNLSIALRHILQQIVDSNNPNGHKNTDMTLPHDGYIQKLSWYFECDKCHYKAFYSHEMECHKHACAMSYDFKSFAKKRKTAAPKRVSSTTHPPTEDSDQDSQPAVNPPPVPPPLKPNFGMSRPMASPTTSRQMSTVSSMPSLKVSQDSPNMVSMEPSSIEFDSEMINPDYIDTPTIPEIDTNSHKTLDFDAIPSRDTLQTDQEELQEQQDQQIDNDMAQPQGFDFDPDILEIKVEVEEGAASSQSTSVKEPLQDPMLLPTDIVFPNSDPSVDSMMSIFSSQPTTQPLSTAATSSTTLSTPSSVPMFKKLPSRPELPFGNIPGIKIPTGPVSSYPNIQSLPHQQHRQHSQQHQQHHQQSQQHQLHQHSQPHQQYPAHHQQQSSAASSYKKMSPFEITSGGVSTPIVDEDGIPLAFSSCSELNQPSGLLTSERQESYGTVDEASAAITHGQLENLSAKAGNNVNLEKTRFQSMPSLKWKGIQTKSAFPSLTLEQKFRCSQLHDSGLPIKNLCMQFNQSKATMNNIIQNKQKIMTEWFRFSNPYITKKQRTLKTPAYAEINAAMLEWYWDLKASGRSPTGVGIQAKAKTVAEQLGYHTFKASNGWLEYFWKRVRRQEQGQISQSNQITQSPSAPAPATQL